MQAFTQCFFVQAKATRAVSGCQASSKAIGPRTPRCLLANTVPNIDVERTPANMGNRPGLQHTGKLAAASRLKLRWAIEVFSVSQSPCLSSHAHLVMAARLTPTRRATWAPTRECVRGVQSSASASCAVGQHARRVAPRASYYSIGRCVCFSLTPPVKLDSFSA